MNSGAAYYAQFETSDWLIHETLSYFVDLKRTAFPPPSAVRQP